MNTNLKKFLFVLVVLGSAQSCYGMKRLFSFLSYNPSEISRGESDCVQTLVEESLNEMIERESTLKNLLEGNNLEIDGFKKTKTTLEKTILDLENKVAELPKEITTKGRLLLVNEDDALSRDVGELKINLRLAKESLETARKNLNRTSLDLEEELKEKSKNSLTLIALTKTIRTKKLEEKRKKTALQKEKKREYLKQLDRDVKISLAKQAGKYMEPENPTDE